MNDGTNRKILDFPSASIYVWSVGGTALTVNADGSFQSSKAWGDGLPGDPGGGGGVDPTTPMPGFQKGIAAGAFRSSPDSSFNADSKTGYQTWSDGTVAVVGGTSASAPLMASRVGISVSMGASLMGYQSKLYQNWKTIFTDVKQGSNGSPAIAGHDTATGLGESIGDGMEAVLGATPPVIPPTPSTVQLTLTATLAAGTYTLTHV